MPPDEGTTEEGTTEPKVEETKTKATAGSSASTFEGKTAEEWAKSYKGLQGAYQKLQNETKTQVDTLNTQLADAQTQIESLKQGGTSKDDQLTVLQTEVAKKQEELTKLQTDKANADQQLQRKNLVMQEFPELASWEAQGLLPSADSDDALREQLEKFRGTLAGQVGAGVKQTLKGASPDLSGKTNTQDSDAANIEGSEDHWWDVMVANSGPNGDPAKFNDAQAKYDALQELKKKNQSQ